MQTYHIDPTYLRTIHDGLLSGSVHPDNASALPESLTGLYASALPASQHVGGRNRFMEFFTAWVLVQKEVSATMVADILSQWLGYGQWTEQTVLEEIATWSKWFNVPTAGTFQIYHERLRAYILQRNSEHQMEACNRAIIACCRRALQRRAADEWERYALQHLQRHLLIPAMQSGDATELRKLCYDSMHWNRQIEIGKGFDWSRRMLDEMMLWASKYDDDEVIECALNKVDLHHLEQNDAPRIVELVAQNDIETALRRIEAFDGNDKEGLQRKFILYMLCLMELTLLESKDKPFRREACEALLKHLDDNLPVDHSILNWNDFFPSYLVFLMASQWAEMDLDYLIVYKRTDHWGANWLAEQGPYSEVQLEVLLACAREYHDLEKKIHFLRYISGELFKQNRLDESSLVMQEVLANALNTADHIRSSTLSSISAEMAKQGKFKIALETAHKIKDDSEKSSALGNVAVELSRQGNFKDSQLVIQEAIEIASVINDNSDRSSALSSISVAMAKQRKFDQAIIIASEITRDWDMSLALKEISVELARHGDFDQALITSRRITEDSEMRLALLEISTELRKQGKLSEAVLVINEVLNAVLEIENDWDKCSELLNIIMELHNQGEKEDSISLIKVALETANKITDGFKFSALWAISAELARQGMFEYALETALGITMNSPKHIVLRDISTELGKLGRIRESSSVLVEALETTPGIMSDWEKNFAIRDISVVLVGQGKLNLALETARKIIYDKVRSSVLKDISTKMAIQGKLYESLETWREITNDSDKRSAIKVISAEFAKQDLLDVALETARNITNEDEKCSMLLAISAELHKQGKLEESSLVIKEIMDVFVGITFDRINSTVISATLVELTKQGQLHQALDIAQSFKFDDNEMFHESFKSLTLLEISAELFDQGKLNESASIISEAIATAIKINYDPYRATTLKKISTMLAKQGKIDHALETSSGIIYDWIKCSALVAISSELYKQHNFEQSTTVLKEAYKTTRKITLKSPKSTGLSSISFELAKKNNWFGAEKIGSEIPLAADRQSCWKKLANASVDQIECQVSLSNVKKLHSDEARSFYLKGWAESVSVTDVDKSCLRQAIQYFPNDVKSLEHLLHHYAIHEVFLGDLSQDKVQRFNQTLSLQWALDIKKSFSNNQI